LSAAARTEFVVTEADAAAIRAMFNQEGELSAAIELRQRFPGVTDNAKARAFARSIAGWTPLPAQPRSVSGCVRARTTNCSHYIRDQWLVIARLRAAHKLIQTQAAGLREDQ
jgi:hypothetical protein